MHYDYTMSLHSWNALWLWVWKVWHALLVWLQTFYRRIKNTSLPSLPPLHSLLIIICQWFFFFSLSVGPLSVSLLNRKAAMSAGRRYEAMCQVTGARPAPAVTWWKGTQQIRDNITTNVSLNMLLSLSASYNKLKLNLQTASNWSM